MNLSEAVQLLQMSRDEVKVAINEGIKHPAKAEKIKLEAYSLNGDYDISDESLDNFIEIFYSDDPKRQIPVAIRRALLVEARYRCANCKETSSLQFHHIIEFNKVPTSDPDHMIVFCANCHTQCTNGRIDFKAQRMIKERIIADLTEGDQFPARFDWEDLRKVIQVIHGVINVAESGEESKYDRITIPLDEKNRLNKMGADYFALIQDQHQPYFLKIEDFLRDPTNRDLRQLYYEILDELNSKLMAQRDDFGELQHVFIQIRDAAKPFLKGNGKTLNIFLSFAYYKCDLGRKSDVETR